MLIHSKNSILRNFLFILRLLYITVIFFLYPHLSTAANVPASIQPSVISSQIDQPTITEIYKDLDNFLWIGTQEGLYRFDGERATKFHPNSKEGHWISHSDIRGISEDEEGRLLVATFGGGLHSWNKEISAFVQLTHPSIRENALLTGLYVDSGSTTWLLSKDRLIAVDPKEGLNSVQSVVEIDTKIFGEIFDITEDDFGNIIVATASGLFSVKNKEKSATKLDFDLEEASITAIEKGPSNSIYIGTSKGTAYLYNLASNQISFELQTNYPLVSEVTDLLYDEKNIWIGTNNGIIFSDQWLTESSLFNESNSKLSYGYITRLYKDQHIFWVGTYQGLDHLSITPLETFNTVNTSIYNDIQTFDEDSSGSLWVGTYNGLFKYNHISKKHEQYFSSEKPGLSDQRIMSISSKEDDIWLGFRQKGIQILDTKTNSLKEFLPEDTGEFAVTKIYHSIAGDTWIATYNKGLFLYHQNKLKAYPSVLEKSVTVLYESTDGTLLASTEHTIYKYIEEEDVFSPLEIIFDNIEDSPMILSISEGSQGDILLGTKDHGLFRLEIISGNAQALQIGTQTPLSRSTVYGALLDNRGDIWCATQQGIFVLGSDYRGKFRLSKLDGLQGEDFNFGATYIDSKGRMYFGGVNGYNRFYPNEIQVGRSSPSLVFNQINLSTRSTLSYYDIQNVETLQLTYNNYFLTFTFSILDYLNPFKSHYKYKLEGFDPDWIDNGTRNSATYTNLPAGDYVFRVIGANSAGVWNEEGISINLKVLPPPWKTWWAYLLYFLAAMTFIWVVMRSYHTYIVKEKALELAEEMYRAADRAEDDMLEQQEMQDELVKAVYQHNLATLRLIGECLHAQANSGSSGPDHQGHIDALTILENCYYYQGGELLTDLHRFTEALISRLLQAAPINPASITTINRVSSNLLPASIASPLALAIYELLDNAVQHAFDGQSPANFIEVSLDAVDNGSGKTAHMQLVVSDDGIGLPVDIQPSEANSHGFQILQVLCTILSATISCDTRNGTVISLIFPQHIPE